MDHATHDDHDGHEEADVTGWVPRWAGYAALGVVAVGVLSIPLLFLDSGSAPTTIAPTGASPQVAQSAMLCGLNNQAADWTGINAPAANENPDSQEYTTLNIQPCATVYWLETPGKGFLVECHDIVAGGWKPMGTCKTGADANRVRSLGDAMTVHYRFQRAGTI